MRRAHEQVADFFHAVGQSIGDVAKPDATVDMELRVKLIAEEFDELLAALHPKGPRPKVMQAVKEWLEDRPLWIEDGFNKPPNLPAVADALADLEYVTVGAAVAWGIPGAEVFDEVHAANMRKVGGPRDPVTGKALKPRGWKGPDIEGVMAKVAAGWRSCFNCGRLTERHCHCENDE